MNTPEEKTEYLRRVAGLDAAVCSPGEPRDRSRVYVNVTAGGVTALVSLPGDSSPELVNLLKAYFADTDKESGASDIETGVYRLIKGVATPEEAAAADRILSSKRYYAVLLTVADAAQWSQLISILAALAGPDDITVKTDLNSALYLKYCDGAYDSSEELAEVLYKGITSDRKIRLTVCSGGAAYGADSVVSAYSRAVTAQLSQEGAVRHYRDCAMSELLKKLPGRELKNYFDYLSEGGAVLSLSPELKETARVFLDCDLSVAAAAKKLYLHRNTLAARLDKIRADTGLDIRFFRQAQLYELISALSSAIKQENG